MPIHINLSGKEIAKSITDLFSPLTELAGLIGDQVRVYRHLALLRTMHRAKEIAEEEGIKMDLPPLKFLIPFMEQCSLENEDDEILIEMWSKLLVASSENFKPEHNLFVRILGELTPSEVKLLQYIVRSEAHDSSPEKVHLEEVFLNFNNYFLINNIPSIVRKLGKVPNCKENFQMIEKAFLRKCQMPGVIIDSFYVQTEDYHQGVYNGGLVISNRFNRMSFAILKSFGLISEYDSLNICVDKYRYEVNAYYITELGARFFCTCNRSDAWVTGGAYNSDTYHDFCME